MEGIQCSYPFRVSYSLDVCPQCLAEMGAGKELGLGPRALAFSPGGHPRAVHTSVLCLAVGLHGSGGAGANHYWSVDFQQPSGQLMKQDTQRGCMTS